MTDSTIRQFGAVDEVDITALAENFIDSWLIPQEGVKRFPRSWGKMGLFLIGEHGLCYLVEPTINGKRYKIAWDAGATEVVLSYNANELKLDLTDVDALAISHGHPDHVGGINRLLQMITAKGRRVPIIVHPDAFLDRWMIVPTGELDVVNHLRASDWEAAGGDIVLNEGPHKITDGMWLTGPIPRLTEFEQSMAAIARYRDPGTGEFIPDSIRDDQAIIINVRNKGLVVMAGCGHAGIINTIRYAQQISGVKKIHAVIGGFHLSFPTPQAAVEQTIEELITIAPTVMIPTHCTGFDAIASIAHRMPESYLLGAVGSTYTFSAS